MPCTANKHPKLGLTMAVNLFFFWISFSALAADEFAFIRFSRLHKSLSQAAGRQLVKCFVDHVKISHILRP